ncbi:MAG: alpha-hydroxyketone-type quorum-sensing autoinducer synthase [Prosthecochloris sp.]|nr:alpha-hydroxyketone-type quorum-sensing autoinducer synthase [Prosthecochloris sp.]
MASSQPSRDSEHRQFPDFLECKLDACERDSFLPRKNGKHLVLGKKPGDGAIMLQSNDYLDIGNHPDIVRAEIEALESSGQVPVMSAVFMHDGGAKDYFERQMADWVGFESSILCQSGWAANVGLMQVIAGNDVPVYIDFFTHMSLWEGIKSAEAKAYPFRHNDPVHLEKQIQQYGRGVILFDSLYSTIGDIAPLAELIDIANRYRCLVVVDESHSLGTHGRQGAGLVHQYGLSDNVDFITASLAKSFAGRAGIIFCSRRFAKYYPYLAHPAIFSSGVMPHEIAALAVTLDIISRSDDRRSKLHEAAAYVRRELDAVGYVFPSESQIVALEPGPESATEAFRDALEERNIFGSVFCSPATPKNRSLMRFSLHSGLERPQLDYLIDVCREIRDEVGMWEWKSTKRGGRGKP